MSFPELEGTEMHIEEVILKEGSLELPGQLAVPSKCKGLVLFAHGSGSSRLSPRNIQVARVLNEGGLGTLLFDLLTEEESEERENVFDIPFLANRLIHATKWVWRRETIQNLPIGYFGASTGGGAALWAAADLGDRIKAVVSRGGRPDLAIPRLKEVVADTLLIVGGNDEPVIGMNQEALKYLTRGQLVIVPGATHLFEEPGTLEAAADYARAWFLKSFGKTGKMEAA